MDVLGAGAETGFELLKVFNPDKSKPFGIDAKNSLSKKILLTDFALFFIASQCESSLLSPFLFSAAG